ncbi:MAG TPA: PaaI family thioesterase [Candidatus Dormibacteraeota bacterium]|nr:PaaI family thioesterase [Candidatus Dormibacteraeota bacterium]
MSLNKRSLTYSWADPAALRDSGLSMSGLEFLYNPIGVVHCGYAMTILDSAMGCAVQTTLAQGEGYTSLETSVNFVRPITIETGRVRCEGSILRRHGLPRPKAR